MDEDTGDRAPPSVTKEGSSTRKMPYERGEFEVDREMDKMFRCNYWEDPAYAYRLQRYGLHHARSAALDQYSERVHRATEAWLAASRQLREARAAATADR